MASTNTAPVLRICIAGGPRTGKTTLATATGSKLRVATRHTDDLASLDWSEASLRASHWLDQPGPWIVEGVAVARALRKWLARNPEGKPCDVVWLLTEAHTSLTPGQRTMAKGCATVFAEIAPELARRGVTVERIAKVVTA